MSDALTDLLLDGITAAKAQGRESIFLRPGDAESILARLEAGRAVQDDGLDVDLVFRVIGALLPRVEAAPYWLTRESFLREYARLRAAPPLHASEVGPAPGGQR